MSSSRSDPSELEVAPTLLTRAVAGFGTSILGGAALGVTAWFSDQLGYPLGLLIPANAIGVWLAVAFALGGSARTLPTGALRGLIGLLSAVAAYYLLIAVLGEGVRAIGASHAATVWGAVALIAGPVMGGAGAVWRYGSGWPRAIGVAVLAASLVGEGVVFGAPRLVPFDQLATDPGAFLFLAEIVIGLTLPFALLRPGERLRGYVATVTLAVVAALAIGPVTTLVRDIADRLLELTTPDARDAWLAMSTAAPGLQSWPAAEPRSAPGELARKMPEHRGTSAGSRAAARSDSTAGWSRASP